MKTFCFDKTINYVDLRFMSDSLNQAFTLGNLQRAWRWTLTNSQPEFKNYFRHIYRAYSLAEDELLTDLHYRLVKGTYTKSHSVKIYQPKKSGIQRTITLISVEDQIVYQALVNIIAEKLTPQIKRHQYKTVFSNIYAGKTSSYFYRKWRTGYRAFSQAISQAYNDGYEFTASFDLTACYDTIDHSVLKHFLLNLKLDNEFCDFLIDLLRHWTTRHGDSPIYQGHGIPQGPLPSGLLAECVLRYFDTTNTKTTKFKYFRYVDDIRLFSKTETNLRKQLVNLDLKSKEIGLFAQSNKIEIHLIQNIDDELKTISNPPEFVHWLPEPNQEKVRKRLRELTPKYKVINETRFKHVLSRAIPNARLNKRLVEVLKRQSHLCPHIYNYFSKTESLPKSTSKLCVEVLKEHDFYSGFTAGLIRVLRDNIHSDYQNELIDYCKKLIDRIESGESSATSELKAAALSVLLKNHSITWGKVRASFSWSHQWWLRSEIIRYLDKEDWGEENFIALINNLLQDKSFDVALVASDITIDEAIPITPSIKIHPQAQILLKKAGVIGRRRTTLCLVSEFMNQSLSNAVVAINWRTVLGGKYNMFLSKVVRWSGYERSDASAWINLTDTLNDILLDSLCTHDGTIGTYQLGGNIGGFISSNTSRFARKYPAFQKCVKEVHNKRLMSDLSHPIVRSTNKSTRPIKHREIKPIKQLLVAGYLELGNNW